MCREPSHAWLKFLLDQKIDLETLELLHLAIRVRNLEAVKLLLQAGADKTKKDASGLTPAELATKMIKDHQEILDALTEK